MCSPSYDETRLPVITTKTLRIDGNTGKTFARAVRCVSFATETGAKVKTG